MTDGIRDAESAYKDLQDLWNEIINAKYTMVGSTVIFTCGSDEVDNAVALMPQVIRHFEQYVNLLKNNQAKDEPNA